GDGSFLHRPHVHDKTVDWTLRVNDLDPEPARRGDDADITDLPAALGIKGRLGDHDLDATLFVDKFLGADAIDDPPDVSLVFTVRDDRDQRGDLAVALLVFVAGEDGRL